MCKKIKKKKSEAPFEWSVRKIQPLSKSLLIRITLEKAISLAFKKKKDRNKPVITCSIRVIPKREPQFQFIDKFKEDGRVQMVPSKKVKNNIFIRGN